MTARIDYMKVAPNAVKAVYGLEHYISAQSGLDHGLIHLIKLRASQINGCAYCVDMHTKEARSHGFSEQWIALVCVWPEAVVFDARERAVLAWVEAVTNISTTGAPDLEFNGLRDHFTEAEIVNLTVAIGTINVWNRLAMGMRQHHDIDAH